MPNCFSREMSEPVHPKSCCSAKFFSFCSNMTYPHTLSCCSFRKKLCLLLWNIDLKKSLSPQIWSTVKGAYFSVNTLQSSCLTMSRIPFSWNPPCACTWSCILGESEGKVGTYFPDYGNPFSTQLYPVHLCDLLRPWGHRKFQDDGAEFLPTSISYWTYMVFRWTYFVFCPGESGRTRAEKASMRTLLLKVYQVDWQRQPQLWSQ